MKRLLATCFAGFFLTACAPVAELTGTPPETRDAVAQTIRTTCDVVEGAPLGLPDEVKLVCLIAEGFLPPSATPVDALAACARLEPETRAGEFAAQYNQVCAPLMTERADTALRTATLSIAYFDSLGDERFVAPKLVLFGVGTETPCGKPRGSVYCPADRQVYLDVDQLARFDERSGSAAFLAGTFFTVAHEVAHDFQHDTGQLVGYGRSVKATRALEHGADCYAGAIAAYFEASGDQLAAGQQVVATLGGRADGTHGSGSARVAAAQRGYEGGDCFV